jgi:hypothetical protein
MCGLVRQVIVQNKKESQMSVVISFRKVAISLAMVVFVALGSAVSAQADPVNFTLTGPDFSGSGNAVAGSLTVLIANSKANTVTFTITNNTDGFVDELYLNNTGWISEGSPVPEPATLLLLGTGLVGIATGLRKRYVSNRAPVQE